MSKKDLENISKIYLEYVTTGENANNLDDVQSEFIRLLKILEVTNPEDKLEHITVDSANHRKHDLTIKMNLRYSSLEELESFLNERSNQLFKNDSSKAGCCGWQWLNLSPDKVALKLSVCQH